MVFDSRKSVEMQVLLIMVTSSKLREIHVTASTYSERCKSTTCRAIHFRGLGMNMQDYLHISPVTISVEGSNSTSHSLVEEDQLLFLIEYRLRLDHYN